MEFVYSDGGRSKYFKADNVGDCAVRAIANATGKDYKEVYDALKGLNNGKSCRNGTPKNVDKKYLQQLGWEWHATMLIGSGCTTHLNADELPNGTLIVSVSKHLTCVKDGVIYDTYDCSRGGERCVYGFWTPPKPKAKPEELLNQHIENMMEMLKEAKGTKGYKKEWKLYELKGYLLETLKQLEELGKGKA